MRIPVALTGVALCVATFAQVPDYVPTNGLQSWYPFNGNTNDESGNGNNGVPFGSTLTADRFGIANAAYSFNGSTAYIALSGNTTIIGDFSMSFWMRPFNTNYGYLIDRDICNNGNDWAVYWQNGQVICRYGTTQSAYFVPGVGLPVGSWHHIAVVRDITAGQLRLFVDGQFAHAIAYPSVPFANTSLPILVGESNCEPGVNPNFMGDLDDIAFWDRVLTPVEVQMLYNGEAPPPCVSGSSVSLSGLNTSYQTTDASSALVGTPDGGVFFGPGVTAATFDPAAAGPGTHTVVYTYIDQNGCVNSTGLCTTVSVGMGINDPNRILGGVHVYPNPADGIFTLELERRQGLVTLTVHDSRGRQVLNQTFMAQGAKTTRSIDLSGEAAGAYILQIGAENGAARQQLIKW